MMWFAGMDIWDLFAPFCPYTYILVLHVFEQSQFSVRSSAVDERLEGSGELLNSHFLTKTHIIC